VFFIVMPAIVACPARIRLATACPAVRRAHTGAAALAWRRRVGRENTVHDKIRPARVPSCATAA
jgi:hypothetical protein